MSAANLPQLELPAGTIRLGPRAVARRLGISVDTADRLLREGRLIAYTHTDSAARVHIEPARKYEVAA